MCESYDYQNIGHKNTNLQNRAYNIKQSTKLKLRTLIKKRKK